MTRIKRINKHHAYIYSTTVVAMPDYLQVYCTHFLKTILSCRRISLAAHNVLVPSGTAHSIRFRVHALHNFCLKRCTRLTEGMLMKPVNQFTRYGTNVLNSYFMTVKTCTDLLACGLPRVGTETFVPGGANFRGSKFPFYCSALLWRSHSWFPLSRSSTVA